MSNPEVWVQWGRAGSRMTEKAAFEMLAEGLEPRDIAAIHDGECHLGRADYDKNPQAGICSCKPRIISGGGLT